MRLLIAHDNYHTIRRSAAPTPSTGDKEPSKPFVVKPVRIDEWRQWLLDQKEEANLSPDQVEI
eukprot:760214-Amorphochlora_amoeboformis.AAC.1